ncbi:CAP-gly domain linker [Citrus sinensis]|uniref:CAP-gly domain linker n=1 Tax=Citrus sinensis TaxID=2711 RepID=A0ACB8LZ22_CITSI|nr:CAP-gly domain linker [Citrus sinensis]
MDDSGAILSHISSLKDMLDQIDEEIESNFQITREIESEIVRCTEIETNLAVKEAELTKILFMSQFEIIGLLSVTGDLRKSVEFLEGQLDNLRRERDEMLKRMSDRREQFTTLCLEFQRDIDKDKNNELVNLLSEKEILENEVHLLDDKINSLKHSMLAFEEQILEDLHTSNSALHVEIESGNQENEKLLKNIASVPNSNTYNLTEEELSSCVSLSVYVEALTESFGTFSSESCFCHFQVGFSPVESFVAHFWIAGWTTILCLSSTQGI